MNEAGERWDEKHRAARARREAEGAGYPEPDPILVELLESAAVPPGGRALDLACGTGRHALLFAQLGLRTDAWDVSAVALEILEQRALADGRTIRTRQVDLEGEASTLTEHAGAYDLIVIADFLDRDLHARAHELLAPAGHLIVVTFTEDWAGERPSRAYRLERGELERGLPGLETVALVERGGRAGLLGRRAPGS